MDLANLPDIELMRLYPRLIQELRTRSILKTRNVVGEFGEWYAIQHYNSNPKLPNLQGQQVASMKNIDAVSNKGERYAIKTTSTRQTGVFHSLPENQSQAFEYLILVIFTKEYELKQILELTWEQFNSYKKWKTPENKYNIRISNNLLKEALEIYPNIEV